MSIKAWLVVNEYLNAKKYNEIHDYLIKASVKQNVSMEIKTNAELLIDLNTFESKEREVDFVLFWDKDIKLAKHLEYIGYKVYNCAKAIEDCDDKALTHLSLMNQGIPMPRTIIAPMTFENIGYNNLDFLDKVISRLGFPMIIKECFGSFGKQVYLVNDKDEIMDILKKTGAKPILFQEYIKASHGRDIRLQVVGGEVVASMYRYSVDGDFRANISNGGKMKAYTPTKIQCDLAIRASAILGLDFCGVDLLFDEGDRTLVCEVNSNAHFKNIYDCTGVNVAEKIIDYINYSCRQTYL